MNDAMTVSELILALKKLEASGYGGYHVAMDGESLGEACLWPVRSMAVREGTQRKGSQDDPIGRIVLSQEVQQ